MDGWVCTQELQKDIFFSANEIWAALGDSTDRAEQADFELGRNQGMVTSEELRPLSDEKFS